MSIPPLRLVKERIRDALYRLDQSLGCDIPRGTAAFWAALRQRLQRGDNRIADTAGTHRELVVKIENYRQIQDWSSQTARTVSRS